MDDYLGPAKEAAKEAEQARIKKRQEEAKANMDQDSSATPDEEDRDGQTRQDR